MKSMAGFLKIQEGRQDRGSGMTPPCPKTAPKLTFWGVRGSTPTLERDTYRYGGNTACLELTVAGGPHFILDCGTGLRMLGNHLHALHNRWTRWQGDGGIEAHVLVTHYHWDHIQGLPFFHPFLSSKTDSICTAFNPNIWAATACGRCWKRSLRAPIFRWTSP